MHLTVLLHGDPRAPQQARLGAALASRGHRVILCDAPGVAAAIRREHGQRCEELTLLSSVAAIPQPLRRLWAKRRARELGVDVVHLNFLRPWHDLWSTMRGGPPILATAWGSDINDDVFQKTRRTTRRLDHVLSRAAAVSADSVPLLSRAKARMGARAAAVPSRIVLWGVDLETFDRQKSLDGAARFRRALGIEPGQRVLLSPRQTKPHYHPDRILRAFAASRWAREGVLVIKLHGRPEEVPCKEALRALAGELGVGASVRFADPCPYSELRGLYAMADAAVSLLEADGVPSTFCELAALGVPIVASDLPAYEGVLQHDERALLVPPRDHGALVAALDRLIDEPDLAPRLAERGRAWALEHADWQRCVDQFEALYRAAMACSIALSRG
ncbi:glycosyltransferase family 4 protein [Sorangium cellulosum]|uniref:glycosyltransferase family 4 protein n=1 Tax=Sorangium cellulosum TaxID=56 RepID=UPI0013311E90|nr:glycosyltransferase family 4 protein [Sorangium cellulosum]